MAIMSMVAGVSRVENRRNHLAGTVSATERQRRAHASDFFRRMIRNGLKLALLPAARLLRLILHGNVIGHLRSQSGLTLVEVLVSLGILGLVGPAFLISMGNASRAIQGSSEAIQGEALVRSQLETIQSTAYQNCLTPPTDCYTVITDIPPQYDITIDVQILDTEIEGVTRDCSAQSNCNTFQEVTVTVTRPTGSGDRAVLSVTTYKVKK